MDLIHKGLSHKTQSKVEKVEVVLEGPGKQRYAAASWSKVLNRAHDKIVEVQIVRMEQTNRRKLIEGQSEEIGKRKIRNLG